MKDIQQKYLNNGFGIIPLKGKIPLVKNWVEITSSESKVYKDENYGVVLKKEDLVIDVDPRNFKNGVNSYKQLLIDMGLDELVFTKTYCVKTGSGGAHIYFKKPPSINVKENIEKYPGVEFKSYGRQVVGPKSIHPDTKKEYLIYKGKVDQINACPIELLNIIEVNKTAIQKDSSSNPLTLVSTDKQSIGRFRSYLITTAPLAIQGDSGDKTTFTVACRGKDFGLDEHTTYALLSESWNQKNIPPWDETELKTKVHNAFLYGSKEYAIDHPNNDFGVVTYDSDILEKIEWKQTADGKTVKNVSNCYSHIQSDAAISNLIGYNEFSHDIEYRRIPPWSNASKKKWEDIDDDMMRLYLSKKRGFDVNPKDLQAIVNIIANKNSFHPVKQFLNSLRWDGEKRVNSWLEVYAGVKSNDYTISAGRKFLLAAISRIFIPGIKFDYLLILEGRQSIGKSFLIDIISHSWGSNVALDPHSKDSVDAMRGKWIIEMAEMVKYKKSDVDALKDFITTTHDRARLAYAKRVKDFPRQCVFIGTINPSNIGYLKDDTGNRRFWPVKCNFVDIHKLRRDYEQLWAEAMHIFKTAPEPLYLEDTSIERYALQEAEKRRQKDSWSDVISEYLDMNRVEEITLADLWTNCFSARLQELDRGIQMRLSSILQFDLLWEKTTLFNNIQARVNGYKRGIL